MQDNKADLIHRVAEAWTEAGQLLGFDVIAPFTLRVRDQSVDCVAFLPHFGGPHGAIVDVGLRPDFAVDRRLYAIADSVGMFYSLVNGETYATYDEEQIKETLKDWGFFGPSGKRPTWWIADGFNS
jgi:hypothetical protein